MSSTAPQSSSSRRSRDASRRAGRSAGGSFIASGSSNTTLPQQRARTSPRAAVASSSTAVRLLKGAVLVAVAVGSAVGVVKVRACVERSSDIAIHNINVTGVAADSPRANEIRAYAELDDGVPFFAVDPDVVAARVARHPYVASVDVRRVPPDSLEIAVTERVARAAVRFVDGLYLVDDEGTVMKRARPGDALDLPVLSLLTTTTATTTAGDDATTEPGATASEPAATTSSVPTRIADALNVVRAAEHTGLLERVSEVVELPGVGFELVLDDGARARIGSDLFEPKLRRLQATEAQLRASGRRFSFMYLDDARHPERVAVRLRPATETTRTGG
jgi:cell division septal protein FtsQ